MRSSRQIQSGSSTEPGPVGVAGDSHPLGPLVGIRVDRLVATCGEFTDQRGLAGARHPGDQHRFIPAVYRDGDSRASFQCRHRVD